jgi:hypothetical protein
MPMSASRASFTISLIGVTCATTTTVCPA